MEQLSHTQSATDLVGDINVNLQKMSSLVEVAVTDSAEALVSKLNTAFASVDGKIVLSKDTDAETFVGNLNTNFGLAAQGGGDEPVVDDGIAAFNQAKYGTEMDSTINRVNALKVNADLIYVVSTDLHYGSNGFECLSDMLSNQKEFVSRAKSGGIPIDAVLCMGDITDGMKKDTTEGGVVTKTAYDALWELARPQLEKMKTYSTPLLICPGNHDNNRDSNNGVVMTDTQQKQLYIDGLVGGAGSNVVFNEANHNLDYYIDYPDKSLRVVMLNANPCDADYTRAISPPSGNTWMWSGPTLRWLARMFGRDLNGNPLSDNTNVMPAGYKALVISHIHPMEVSAVSYILPSSGETASSRTNADNILSRNKDRIWSIVSGHHHADNVMSSYIMSTRLAANKGQSGSLTPYRAVGSIKPPRDTGDYTKDLWDVMLLNQKDRRIDLIRFGGGFDRHIHLEEIECAAGDSAVLTPNQSLLGNGTLEWHVQDTPIFYTGTKMYYESGAFTRMQYERVADVDNGVVNVWAKREHYDYDTRNTPAESLVEETQEQGSTIGKRFIVFCQSPTAREYWCIIIVGTT